MAVKKAYNAESIDTLDIMVAARLRVGMYLGSADDDAIAVATREVIDNSIDEHMNGHGDKVIVYIDPTTGLIGVEDRARGIPIEEHPKHKGMSTLQVVLTQAHSGGKFGDQYGVSGGLHGTGLKAVTATSTHLRATVWRDGMEHTLIIKDQKVAQDIMSTKLSAKDAKKTGTRIEFRLDETVFKDATSIIPSHETLRRMLRERAYLNPDLTLQLHWGKEPVETFATKEGIAAYVSDLAGDKMLFKKVAYVLNPTDSEIPVAVAIAWTSNYSKDGVQGFCNCVRQPEGGTHIQGLRMALPSIVRNYIEANNVLMVKDKDLKIEGVDCFEGVQAIVSVRHRSPVFKGQSKGSLSNTDVQGAVQRTINAELTRWLEENPKEAKTLALRAIAAAKARIAASKARDQVRKQDAGTFGMRNFGKLKDCASKDTDINELFVVEGDSAGGSGSMARDRNSQAIYALKGKPLNTWECDHARIFSNNEMSDLTCALGTGLFTDAMTEEEIDAAIGKLRYGKVIVLADADIDGSHIECLLIGHFFKHLRPLMERGHIFMALPPLYRVTERSKHTFYRDEAALSAFFRKRAKSVVAGDEALITLAGVTISVRSIIESAASTIGIEPADLAQAIGAACSYDSSREDWLMAFAEKIVEARSENCEGIEADQLVSGAVVIRGLEPSGRYFTTVITESFVNTVTTLVENLMKVIPEDAFSDLLSTGVRTINGVQYSDIYQMVCAIDKVSQQGLQVMRNKGLGEMEATELGETTLDVGSRRLIRVTVDDFDDTGTFIGTLLNKSDVEARRELVRNTVVDKSLVDA